MEPTTPVEGKHHALPPRTLVELTGLPGVGKTAACRALLAGTPEAKRSRVSRSWRKLRKSIVPRLVLPIALIRYRRLLRALSGPTAGRIPRARAILPFFRRSARHLRRSDDPFVSTLYLLTSFTSEVILASAEARLRRRTLIMDEGFIHRAFGVWTRCPPDARAAVVAAYFATIPDHCRCIHLRSTPEAAIARASKRARGIPFAAARAAATATPGGMPEDATATFQRAQIEIFGLERFRSRHQLMEIDASGTPEEIAALVVDALIGPNGECRFLVFLRE